MAIKQLPAYSQELNLVEKLKCEWINTKAFQSLKKLQQGQKKFVKVLEKIYN